MGRLTIKPNELMTMRDLYESGLIASLKEGVKLLADVSEFSCHFSFVYFTYYMIFIG